ACFGLVSRLVTVDTPSRNALSPPARRGPSRPRRAGGELSEFTPSSRWLHAFLLGFWHRAGLYSPVQLRVDPPILTPPYPHGPCALAPAIGRRMGGRRSRPRDRVVLVERRPELGPRQGLGRWPAGRRGHARVPPGGGDDQGHAAHGHG